VRRDSQQGERLGRGGKRGGTVLLFVRSEKENGETEKAVEKNGSFNVVNYGLVGGPGSATTGNAKWGNDPLAVEERLEKDSASPPRKRWKKGLTRKSSKEVGELDFQGLSTKEVSAFRR